MAARKKDKSSVIEVPAIGIARFKLRVKARGDSTLIVHSWSEKATKEMRDKQQGKAKMKKEAKDPHAEFMSAKYLDAKGRDCVKAAFFKNAFVSAARFAADVKMTELRGAVFFLGDLIPLTFKKCLMREDHVRVGMGTADLRYRPEYFDWSVELHIEYNTAMITPEQIVNLIQLAGFGVGLCEWRPECSGDHGRFEVDEKSMASISGSATAPKKTTTKKAA